ncbi:cytochrome c [Robertmurraya massiliosenegalensis]|uniref:c-type cytochrome n=1 Tax=Robertmurraya TaxID=2837507 RepID=UPI0039A43883
MKKILTLLVGTLVLLAACSDDDSSSNTNDSGEKVPLSIEEVKNVYSQSCSRCHGQILADGVPGDLENIGTELSEEEIDEIIRKGKGMMPGRLVKEEEAAAIAEWLSTIK